MQIFLRNTETNENFPLTYIPLDLEWSSGENRYSAADIPLVGIGEQPQYWQSGGNAARSVVCTLEGTDVLERLQKLEKWTKPIVTKKAPPVCLLQVGALDPVWCVLVSVAVVFPLTKFKGEKPTRAQVTIAYQVIPEEAIA